MTWHPEILLGLVFNGLAEYVEGTLPQPSVSSEPHACANWMYNDRLTRGFLLQYIDPCEQEFVKDATTAKACWDALKARHEKEGLVRQLQLLTEALNMSFSLDKPLLQTAATMHDLVKQAFAAGDLRCDIITSLVFLHGMESLPNLQSVVNHNLSMATTEKPYKPTDIMRLLENEQHLRDSGKSANTSSTALITRTNASIITCSNCKKNGHTANYCVSPGGGIGGKDH